jgi:hypothetical protein
MITAHSSTAPEIHGLILLDCWEPPAHKFSTEKFYVDLIDQLQKYKFKCIVNSPSNSRFDQDDPSLERTLEIYGRPSQNSNGIPITDSHNDLRRYRVVTNIIKSFVTSTVPEENALPGMQCAPALTAETTSTLIKKYLLKTDLSIFLTNYEDLSYHATVYLEGLCKNWLVVGQTWQMCTHDHALGLKHLTRLPGLSFYATDFGFYKEHGGTAGYEDFANDSLDWEHIENFGYRLIPGSPDLINTICTQPFDKI